MNKPNAKTKLALALRAYDTREALDIMEKSYPWVDIVEVRLDLMTFFDLKELLKNRPLPVIVTYRPKREGGAYEGEEKDRISILYTAIENGADYIDCEWDSYNYFRNFKNTPTKIIVSHHDFKKTPNLLEICNKIQELQPDVTKVVGMAHSLFDSFHALSVLPNAKLPTISLTMGGKGILSRILAPRFGAFLTYGSLAGNERGTAPGQISIYELHQVFHISRMSDKSTIIAYLHPTGYLNLKKELAYLNETCSALPINTIFVPIELTHENILEIIYCCKNIDITRFVITPPLVGDVLKELKNSTSRGKEVGLFLETNESSVKHFYISPFSTKEVIKRFSETGL